MPVRINAALLTVMVVVTGCGEGRPADRPAVAITRGIVTYQNKPVSEAVIVLQPDDPEGTAASAMTDPEGKFDVMAFPPESGAVPGSYSVMIMKISQEDLEPDPDKKSPVKQPKSLIPVKYSNPTKSGLKLEVPADGNDNIIFDLKD